MLDKYLAVNSGSSSLKFKLFEMPAETVIIKGIFEEIGVAEGHLSYELASQKKTKSLILNDHQAAVEILLELLLAEKVIESYAEIQGIGHRVAHGGEYFKESTVLKEADLVKIRELSQLAPIHNPVNLLGIEAFARVLPDVVTVGVFDTAFHQSLTPAHYIYPIPYEYYEKYRIRRYGFHGTSHQYVTQEALALSKLPPETKIISCHLGNGASICAIENGQSVNTSMGFTPLSGVMMGTRSGDIDPSILPFIQEQEGLSAKEIEKIINYQSGLVGVSGISNDFRKVQEAAEQGNQRAQLALELFINRISSVVASYVADLNGLDMLIFTAGIGENSAYVRAKVCQKLAYLGIELNHQKNQAGETWLQEKHSKVRVGLIPTDEELVIARDTYRLK